MNYLITVLEDEPRVSHRIVAENTGNKQININKLINENIQDFEEFGKVELIIAKVQTKGGRQNQKTFFLNEQQATLLMTYLRNSEIVRKFKKSLVKEFFAMKDTKNIKFITGGYKSQISQKNSKIKALEEKVLMLEAGFDKKIDYRLKAKALYPVILHRIDQIEDEFVKEFRGQSLELYAKKLDEIKLLLSREAKVCKYMTFLGNGTAVNNLVIEDKSKKLNLK